MQILVNPMNETASHPGAPAPRMPGLQGRRIALLDISKPGGSVFLDRVEQMLQSRYGTASVIREMKPTFAKPAPLALIEKLRDVDAVIESLAD